MIAVADMSHSCEACLIVRKETLVYLFLAGLGLKEFVVLQTVVSPDSFLRLYSSIPPSIDD
jgi:hypothetical protein